MASWLPAPDWARAGVRSIGAGLRAGAAAQLYTMFAKLGIYNYEIYEYNYIIMLVPGIVHTRIGAAFGRLQYSCTEYS